MITPLIDIHCHILPGLDDGPQSLEESIEMCKIAAEDGIATIVATPHFRPGTYEGTDISEHIQRLQREIARQGIRICILPGYDISVTPELPAYLRRDTSLFINRNGKYFLCEMPHETIPAMWDRFLLSVKQFGMTPIITHPERNRGFLRHPDALFPFVLGGGLIQITAMSVTGEFGPEAQEYCGFLLHRNLVHIIATDAHSAEKRRPILSEAMRVAADIVGKDAASRLVRDAPQAVIEGRQVDAPEPIMVLPRKKRWYHRVLDV